MAERGFLARPVWARYRALGDPPERERHNANAKTKRCATFLSDRAQSREVTTIMQSARHALSRRAILRGAASASLLSFVDLLPRPADADPRWIASEHPAFALVR
jgi:hypothetical protein